MNIVTHIHGSTTLIELTGRITIGHGDVLLRESVQAAIAAGSRSIVIDAAGVSVLDSSGTGELVAAHRMMQELGGRFAIARISPRVGGVLVATRLSGVLEIHESLEGALLEVAA